LRATTNIATCTYTLARMRIATGRATPRHSLITWTAAGIARAHGLPDRAVAQHAWAGHRTDPVPRWGHRPRKNSGSHIDASLSRQPLVKGERLVRYEVNAVMPRRCVGPSVGLDVCCHVPFHGWGATPTQPDSARRRRTSPTEGQELVHGGGVRANGNSWEDLCARVGCLKP
jgi:hypothetical protein